MTLRTRFGYPVGLAAGVVGVLRQTQRWLPRYEWLSAHHLAYYVAVLNLLVVAIGAVGVFAIGVRADRELGHRWRLSPAVSTAFSSAIMGLGIGTALAVYLQPGHNTITTPLISFLIPMAVYIGSHGVPIGFAAIAGLAASRIHAIETAMDATTGEATTDTDTECPPKSSDETDDNRQQTVDATAARRPPNNEM